MYKRKISALHFIIVFSIFAIILVILLCLPKYSQEQLEALERLDPKKYLTENDYVFSLTREELLEEKLNNGTLKKDENGKANYITLSEWVNEYHGCTEPVTVSFSFYGSGKPASVNYWISSDFGNSYKVVDDFPSFITQVREDMICLYGTDYREIFKSSIDSFDELLRQLESGEGGFYEIRFNPGSSLYVLMDEEDSAGHVKSFYIRISLGYK